MNSHDLLVMPSRLEGFGIVFVEAMSRGLPCIGRKAFAMTELIDDGVTGGLVDSDDPPRLAEKVLETLHDDAIYLEVVRRSTDVAQTFNWGTTAQTILRVIGASAI